MTKAAKLRLAVVALLAAALGSMLVWLWLARSCAAEGGVFEARSWTCRMPLPIILERGIRRS